MSDAQPPITVLLDEWKGGSSAARAALLERLYPDLKRIASARLRASGAHTLQPTALVNEFVLRMLDQEVSVNDRAHFMALAATAMRGILVDHARTKRSLKRGGDQLRVTLTESVSGLPGNSADMIDLDRALAQLESLDERKVRAIELQVFGGMDLKEIAEVLDVSRATIARDLQTAKAWLAAELESA